MKNFLLALLAFLVLPNLAVKTEAQDTLAKSLLWEVTGNGLEKPSYVFGTIHMIDRAHYFLSDAAVDAFKKSTNVTFEIDMEEMTDMSALMPLMMKAFMRGDTTLKDLLTSDDYKVVSDHFNQMGLPMMFVERIKPMFLSAMAAGGDMSNPAQQQDIVSYEMELMTMAQQQEKEVMGLETAEYQMSMFDSIPYSVQAEMLVESIRSEAAGSDQMERMIELYTTQDIEGMQTMMEDDEDILNYQDLLLVTRNRNWIPVMENRMAAGPSFFAVGAGHLAGAEGVLKLLMEAGYTVKPLF